MAYNRFAFCIVIASMFALTIGAMQFINAQSAVNDRLRFINTYCASGAPITIRLHNEREVNACTRAVALN